MYTGPSKKQSFHSKPPVPLRRERGARPGISTWKTRIFLKRPRAGPLVSASNWPRFKLAVAFPERPHENRPEAGQALGVAGKGRLEGAVAQLGERLICIQEVAGSIPTSSTRLANRACSSVG